MASFLGDREALTPKGGKRKLGRSASGTARDAGPSSSDDFMSDSSIKKKKKKKHSKEEESQEIPELATMSALKLDSEDPEVTWSKEESQTLLDKIKSLLPPNDTMKYTTRIEKLDWEQAKFEKFTAEQCKTKWQDIASNIRKYRLLGELLTDAKSFVANPPHKSVMKHPDMPKRPLTPYFRFFLAKRAKIAAKHPELSQTDLTKEISKDFRELSAKKKKKYQEDYDADMQEFHVKLAKFKEEHPDLYTEKERDRDKSGSGPPKPITAMQLYINSKAEEAVKKDTTLTRKQLYDQYRVKWGDMSDHKKMKHINKAIEAKTKYDEEMRAYCDLHADYVPKEVKTFLSKAEQKIKDRHDGKPEKPPPNGYGMFSVDMMTRLTDVPSTKRMTEVSRRWKALTDKERDRWNSLCKEKNATYVSAYKEYVRNLPEEERSKIKSAEAELAAKRQASRKQKAPTKASRGKQKPVAAVFLYITEQKAAYKKKYPEMGDHELTRMLAKEYTLLSDVDKDKYKLMEEEQRDILSQCLEAEECDDSPEGSPPKKSKKKKKAMFPGEPKKPPGSGYQLFTIETLPSLADIPNKDRLQNISQKWSAKSAKEKAVFSKRRDTMVEKYKKELAKFKKKLSPKDLKRYEEGETQGKSGNKAAANKKDTEEEEEEEEEEESESGSGSSSSSEADSDSDSGDSASSTDRSDDESAEPDTKTNGVAKESKGKLSANDVYSSSDSDSNSSSSSDSE